MLRAFRLLEFCVPLAAPSTKKIKKIVWHVYTVVLFKNCGSDQKNTECPRQPLWTVLFLKIGPVNSKLNKLLQRVHSSKLLRRLTHSPRAEGAPDSYTCWPQWMRPRRSSSQAVGQDMGQVSFLL